MRFSFQHLLFCVVAALGLSASFFTYRVIVFKRSLGAGAKTVALTSGQEAQVLKVIDGDEIAVQVGTEALTVRILGLYSYDPTLMDPQVQPAARAGLDYLQQALGSKKINLVFDELKCDGHKRLLAYVQLEGEDIGLAMITKGLSLAYTKYPFSRLHPYSLAEQKAREEKRGLWADPQMALRSTQLRALWESERTRGE